MSKSVSAIEVAKRVIDIEMAAIKRLRNSLSTEFEKAIETIYQCNGRVIVSGLGKSGAIGRKIAATLASTGTPAYFLHATEGLHGDLGIVHRNDVVICISKSGNTEEVNQLLPVFKRLNVPVIGMTGNKTSKLGQACDIFLDISVAEEACPNDLAPTASTTVSLVMGDALAVALLEKRHFTKEDFAILHPAGSLGKKLLLNVAELMETGDRVAIIKAQSKMHDVVPEMANKRGICVVTNDSNDVLGVLTAGDLNRLLKKGEQFFDLTVSEAMTKNPKMVSLNTKATTALLQMEQYQIMAMPVVDENDKLAGMLHLHDLLDAGVR